MADEVTFQDKVDSQSSPLPRVHKVVDDDMNQLKRTANQLRDEKMDLSVYDPDNDGKVVSAENADVAALANVAETVEVDGQLGQGYVYAINFANQPGWMLLVNLLDAMLGGTAWRQAGNGNMHTDDYVDPAGTAVVRDVLNLVNAARNMSISHRDDAGVEEFFADLNLAGRDSFWRVGKADNGLGDVHPFLQFGDDIQQADSLVDFHIRGNDLGGSNPSEPFMTFQVGGSKITLSKQGIAITGQSIDPGGVGGNLTRALGLNGLGQLVLEDIAGLSTLADMPDSAELALDNLGGNRYGKESPQTHMAYTLGASIIEGATTLLRQQSLVPPELPVVWCNDQESAWAPNRINLIRLFAEDVPDPPAEPTVYAWYEGSVPAASVAWTPATFAAHWMNVGDLALSDGTDVPSIPDSIGAGAFASAGGVPTYDAATGLLNFVRTESDYLKSVLGVTYSVYTVSMLIQMDVAEPNYTAAWGNDVDLGTPGAIALAGRGGGQYAMRVNSAGAVGGNNTLTQSVKRLVTVVVNGSDGAVYLDRNLNVSGQSYSGDLSSIVIGAAAESGGVVNGSMNVKVGDVVVKAGVITAPELDELCSYMEGKFNYTS